ncbi:MAG TPA: electron transfer flavoprotein subunit alpha/FixB family protein [Bdellovibrionota bacterium]|nr:electron transfer flavoprotein subunit alpha/FixB family protein [Bdellovibrionota bacterium]
MLNNILVLIEHREGQTLDYNFGTLGLASQLAKKWSTGVAALILSDAPESLLSKLKSKKIDEIITVKNEKLKNYSSDAYAEVLSKLIETNSPKALLFAHSSIGWDVAPKLSYRLNVGLVSEVNAVEFSGEVPIFSRQVYNGKLVEKVKLQTSPYLLTVERGGFPEVEEGGSPRISEVQVPLDNITPRTRVKGIVKAEKGGVDLTKSKIIVSGGRGLGKKENFQIIKDLALSLHGDYAASRPVVDNEWTEKDRQVGSSGKTVAPKLYVACGISGAIQHLSGMKKSDVIVAINKDPEAPIFGIATYGVVGDLFEIVPALISEAKKQGI